MFVGDEKTVFELESMMVLREKGREKKYKSSLLFVEIVAAAATHQFSVNQLVKI